MALILLSLLRMVRILPLIALFQMLVIVEFPLVQLCLLPLLLILLPLLLGLLLLVIARLLLLFFFAKMNLAWRPCGVLIPSKRDGLVPCCPV